MNYSRKIKQVILTLVLLFSTSALYAATCPDYIINDPNVTFHTSGTASKLLSGTCYLEIDYCAFTKNGYNWITTSEIRLVGDCLDEANNYDEFGPRLYLDEISDAIVETNPWGMNIPNCPAQSQLMIKIGDTHCWTNIASLSMEWDYSVNPPEQIIIRTYEPCITLTPEGGVDVCTETYTACKEYINGEWVIIKTLVEGYTSQIDCPFECRSACD